MSYHSYHSYHTKDDQIAKLNAKIKQLQAEIHAVNKSAFLRGLERGAQIADAGIVSVDIAAAIRDLAKEVRGE